MSAAPTTHTGALLARFHASRPESAALLGLLVVATAPATARAVGPTELAAVHAAYPLMRTFSAEALQELQERHASPTMCFGPVRASQAPAVRLAFDRRLGALFWTDKNGLATTAPSKMDIANVAIDVVGAIPAPGQEPQRVTYLFAHNQPAAGEQQTLRHAQQQIPGRLTDPEVLPSQLDGCTLADVQDASAQAWGMDRVTPSVPEQMAKGVATDAAWTVRAAAQQAISTAIYSGVHSIIKP